MLFRSVVSTQSCEELEIACAEYDLTHTHPYTLTHTHPYTLTHTHTQHTQARSHRASRLTYFGCAQIFKICTPTLTYVYSHTHSLTCTYTRSVMHTLIHKHTHTHTNIHAHTLNSTYTL